MRRCLSNFQDTINKSEFQDLDICTLKRLLFEFVLELGSPSPLIIVVEAIKKWANVDLETKRPFLPELLRLVDFNDADPLHLVEISRYELFRNSTECMHLIDPVKDRYILMTQLPGIYPNKSLASKSHLRAELKAIEKERLSILKKSFSDLETIMDYTGLSLDEIQDFENQENN